MEPFKSSTRRLSCEATIRFPGGGGGGVDFSDWPEYFFFSLSGPEYFYYEPEFVSQTIVGQNICFYAMQIWKQLYSYESVTKLHVLY